MLRAITDENGQSLPHDPTRRGYHAVYREDAVNHCPGCGRTHWYVGRLMAECGFCATALPLADASIRGGSYRHAYKAIWAVGEAA